LTSLVYEKQQKLRIMMKMHGLGDGPYWMISYGYFLVTSIIYMLCFVIFGSILGKNITIELIPLWIFPISLMLFDFIFRIKNLHQWLQHPICILFYLYKLTNCASIFGGLHVFKYQDCYRFHNNYFY